VLSAKAIAALHELQEMKRQWTLSRLEAERFQYRLGALIVCSAGGVLRPSSVSGLVMASLGEDMKAAVDSIRRGGYSGSLTYATDDGASSCILLNLLAFKNMASHDAAERLCYVLCPVVSDLLRFFHWHARPLLSNPLAGHRMTFVKPDGSWFDSSRDGFGRLCGEQGLVLGTSVRVVRHIISSAVVRAGLAKEVRADICAANLHTVAVADRYYVVDAGQAGRSVESAAGGDFERGLGKRARSPFSSPFAAMPLLTASFVVYSLFTPEFRTAFGVPLDYRGILRPASVAADATTDDPMPLDNAFIEPLAPLLPEQPGMMRICSRCTKSFRKSPSHQGTLCWSCKKNKPRPLADY